MDTRYELSAVQPVLQLDLRDDLLHKETARG